MTATVRMALRELKVPWPTPTRDGLALACPLCGLSQRHFGGPPTVQREKLERHVRQAHARCKACGWVTGAHRMPYHRHRWHAYPTMVLPGLEHVA